MFKNKKDVDKHVEGLVSKLSLREFKSRAYSIARLYFEVADYASCQKYVEQYISQKENNAAAYKLLGQALQKLGHKERALEQFKTSLELDPTQTSLILEICELLADDEILIDPVRAKYWSEKAEAIFPRHPTTFRLREKLVASCSSDPDAVIDLIKSELKLRPKDPTLHGRLLKLYQQSNKFKEAFEHGCQIEFGGNTFLNHIAWYETLAEIIKHASLDRKNWMYQLLYLTVRDRLCVLSLSETPNGPVKSIVECSEILHQFDQAIQSVIDVGIPAGYAEYHAALLQHHCGQFAFHAATFLLKKAKKDQLSWRDATRTAGLFMLIAWHTAPIDVKVSWLTLAPEKYKVIAHRWYVEGSYRCSQAGHYLIIDTQNRSQAFIDYVSQTCSAIHWRDKLYEKVFTIRDQLSKIKTSHVVTEAFTAPIVRLPRKAEVEAYDVDAQRHYPNSLHHYVWILMNYTNFTHFQFTLFEMMKPTSRNSSNCGTETLNKLDIQAFLYISALTAQQQRVNQSCSFEKPYLLPANIADLLCPYAHLKWWDCAYKYSQNQLGSELSDIRTTLSRGIEVVRCVDNHGLDPELLCKLGRIFSERAKNTTSVEEKNNLECRAGLYYSTAYPLLEKIKKKIAVRIPEKRMFNYTHKELSNNELNSLIEESKLYVAVNHLNDGRYELALELMVGLKSPQTYYHLSQIYHKMAMELQNSLRDSTDNEMRSKYVTLLGKARTFAYKALDRFKMTHESPDHPLFVETQQLVDIIEANINRLDPDISVVLNNDNDVSSDENENTSSTISERANNLDNFCNYLESSTPRRMPAMNNTSYRTANDSQIFDHSRNFQKQLEKLEAEVRTMRRKEPSINAFMEQSRNWFEENRNMGNKIMSAITSNLQNTNDQFKLLQISVDKVKDQMDECRVKCKDVGEIKKQIAELKKEVGKLRTPPSDQTDENELYHLEDEYRTSDCASNFTSQLPFTPPLMPQFNQRLVPPFPIPPNPFQFYGQNLFNMYPQAGHVAGAIFDPLRSQVNYPGMFPTPEQIFPDLAHLIPPNVPGMPIVPPIPVTVPPPAGAPRPAAAPMPAAAVPAPGIKETPRSLPINVVITSSDPLPTCTTAPQPVLSVTIPPKHIKGTPHNYQITMPATGDAPTIFSSGILGSTTDSKPITSWNQATAFKTAQSSISTPGANAPSDNATFSLFGTPRSIFFDNNITVVDGATKSDSPNTSLNKSRTLSERSNTSVENYDPCPDFKPIVPLPAEIKVTTGEEDETAIFCARSKLFRFTDNQWKERGIGEMKLLKHKVTSKVRVLMRREQVHKICANHLITAEMEIQPMKNEVKAYFWAANDFADESLVFEKFCVRFKTPEIAKEFYEKFEEARKIAKSSPRKTNITISKKDAEPLSIPKKDNTSPAVSQANKTVVGGFTFSSTPSFKPVKDEKPDNKPQESANTKVNPFSSLAFKSNGSTPFSNLFTVTSENNVISSTPNKEDIPTKLNSSDTVEEFEPTVEFKPVVPLPALVETKTGEENETVLFEHRAKLLRFESSSKEWKERGLGNIKILAQKHNNQKVRLLMRREQVMKVCCNHAITKDLTFTKMPNMDKAVTWCAKDFSEGELVPETFCLRFKTVQACDDFTAAIKSVQSSLQDDAKVTKEVDKTPKDKDNSVGFGDKFKPKPGSWCCEACYTNNLESFTKCACCEQPRPQTGKVENAPSAPTGTLNWGEQFKPKSGTWECKECYIRNEANVENCSACNSPKDPTAVKKDTERAVENAPKFSFGIPSQPINTFQVPKTNTPKISAPVSGFGDKFKPKEGSWECKQCFVRNDSNLAQCSACTSPKDPNAVKKETNSIFDSVVSGPKFNFGIPAAAPSVKEENREAQPVSLFDGAGGQKFSFGIPSNGQPNPPANIFGTTGATGIIFATPKKPDNQIEGVLNMSLKKNDEVTVTPVKPALLPTPKSDSLGSKEGFGFVFKPKTSTKGKSPVKSPRSEKGEESDDNEYASEDEGHHLHFSPVVPLPDKIEVVTGEENEDELYGHRAKLFRFVDEWKERGIGVVKILKHRDTGKLRVVMRREQVLKICLNHALTSDIKYALKDEKTWLFAVNDFSEGELSLQKFGIRFKTKEIASEFKNAIDRALGKETENKNDNNQKDDVIFVNEIQASSEEKERARELMLPENFFNYNKKTPCQGCRGCKDSDEESTPSASTSESATVTTPNKTGTPTFFSPATSVYGTPNNFNRTVDNSIFRTPLESIGSNTNKSNNIFGFGIKTASSDKENSATPKTSVFGGVGMNQSVFATPQGSVFNNSDMNTPPSTKNIFAISKPDTTTEDEKQKEPKSLFGNISDQKSIFGSPASKIISDQTSIFGSPASRNISDQTSIFGSPTSKNISDQKSIFGTPTSKNISDQKSIFGLPSNGNNSVFGMVTPSTDDKSRFGAGASLFGSSNSNQSIFEKSPSIDSKSFFSEANKSLFGDKSVEPEKPEIKSIFSLDTDQKPVNLFSSAVQGSLFGPAADKNPAEPVLFGSKGASLFDSKNTNAAPVFGSGIFSPAAPTAATKEEKSIVLGTTNAGDTKSEIVQKDIPLNLENTLSFASLSSGGPGFKKNENFKWEGAGQQLFTAAQLAAQRKAKGECGAGDEGGEATGEEEYDPYYEPIVPLPDKIIVTTGEEDEEKLFGERAKLFRFEPKTKEFKERGVGEVKILYHPHRHTYRLLLRREQVHKAVLNMLLFMDLELLPMKNSSCAWTWAGINYAEVPEGEQETLALRFKNSALATAFKDKVVECTRKLQAADAQAIREAREKPLRLPKHLAQQSQPSAEQTGNEDGKIAPLRLPKHLEPNARSDPSMPTTVTAVDQTQNGNRAAEEKQNVHVHFNDQEEANQVEELMYLEGYENEDDYYNEEDDAVVYYSCDGEALIEQGVNKTSCAEAQIQVMYDQEVYSPKILVTDANTGEILADMLIHNETEFQMEGDSCTWTGTDYTNSDPLDKTVTINFADSETAQMFYDSCETSKGGTTYSSTDPES